MYKIYGVLNSFIGLYLQVLNTNYILDFKCIIKYLQLLYFSIFSHNFIIYINIY